MPAVRRGKPSHAIGGVQNLAPPASLELGVRERDGWRERLPYCRLRQDLPAVDLSVVHERDQPLRHIHDVRVDRASGCDTDRIAVVRDLIQLGVVAPLRIRDARFRRLEHVRDGEGRAPHAERREDAIADEVLPRRAGEQLDGVARTRVHHVVVEEYRARRL